MLEREVPKADAIRELVRISARALGVGTLRDIADYFRLLQADAKAAIADLVDTGELAPVTVEGWNRPAWLHTAARIPRRVEAVAVLSPFDPIVWERERALRMFGFDYRIEIYTPAPKRVYGYYTLPLLIDDQLVGRIDLKSDRQNKTLRVQSAWREPAHSVDLERSCRPDPRDRGLAGPRRRGRAGLGRPGARAAGGRPGHDAESHAVRGAAAPASKTRAATSPAGCRRPRLLRA